MHCLRLTPTGSAYPPHTGPPSALQDKVWGGARTLCWGRSWTGPSSRMSTSVGGGGQVSEDQSRHLSGTLDQQPQCSQDHLLVHTSHHRTRLQTHGRRSVSYSHCQTC